MLIVSSILKRLGWHLLQDPSVRQLMCHAALRSSLSTVRGFGCLRKEMPARGTQVRSAIATISQAEPVACQRKKQ